MRMAWFILFLIIMGNKVFSQYIVEGIVKDEANIAISNVNILNKSIGTWVQTDVTGRFSIKGTVGDTVMISKVGYQSISWLFTEERDVIIFQIKESTNVLEEIEISTGYQKIRKDKLTGSAYYLDRDHLDLNMGSSVLDRLKDVVPGLNFLDRHPNLTIRGVSTIHGNMSPLIVIDDFPYEGDINDINPEDVENISVLKDAAAAAIWGTRAGNGVIVITTKKGSYERRPDIDFQSNVTVGNKPDLFYTPRMSVGDYIDTERRVFEEGGYAASENNLDRVPLSEVVELLIANRDGKISSEILESSISQLRNYDIRNDLNKYLFRKTMDSRSSLNIRGGGAQHIYSISTGYDRSLPQHLRVSNDRFTLRSNNSFSFFERKLTVQADIFGVFHKNNMDGYSIYTDLSPYERLVDDDNRHRAIYGFYRKPWLDQAEEIGLLDWQYRPLDELENGDRNKRTENYQFNIGAEYKIVHDLRMKLLYQYVTENNKEETHYSVDSYFARDLINKYTQLSDPEAPVFPIPKSGILNEDIGRNTSQSLRGILQYDKAFAKHEINGMVGWEMRDRIVRSGKQRFYGYESEFMSNQVVDYKQAYPMSYFTRRTSTIPFVQSLRYRQNRHLSYYANLNYSFDGRFTISASVRKDQSNVFGVSANLKGVPLYSLGAVWNLHKEPWLTEKLKGIWRLRASYGYNGNMDNSLSSEITAKYLSASATYLNRAEIVNPPNADLRWERIQNTNVGLQWVSENARLDIGAEYYLKNGLDLIGDSPYAASSGVEFFRGNTASTKGKGFELVVKSTNVDRTFKWKTGILFSHGKEKIERYLLKPSVMSNVIENGSSAFPVEGASRFAVFSYPWAGLEPTNGNPRGYLNGEVSDDYQNIISSTTLENVKSNGPSFPTVFGSIRNTFLWRQWSASVNITYRFGYYVRMKSIFYGYNYGLGGHGDIYKRWTKPDDEKHTNVMSMPTSGGDSYRDRFYNYASQLIEKGDHIRLNDIRIAYADNYNLRRNRSLKIQYFMQFNNISMLWVKNSRNIEPDNNNVPYPFQLSIGTKIGL